MEMGGKCKKKGRERDKNFLYNFLFPFRISWFFKNLKTLAKQNHERGFQFILRYLF